MSLLRRRPQSSPGGNTPSGQKPFVPPTKRSTTTEDDESAMTNRRAMRNGGSLAIKKLPILSFLADGVKTKRVHQQFKTPCEGIRSAESDRLLQVKTLGMRRRFTGVPSAPLVPHNAMEVEGDLSEEEEDSEDVELDVGPSKADENAPPPLVLWQSEEDPERKVVVPEIVGKFLRPHQREGVQFMFDCVCQVRGFDGQGCILADDMGLGKTLQSIAIMYTLLCTSMEAVKEPTIRRAIVVCPTSLVKNWDDEITKWLNGRVKTIALFEASRDIVIQNISKFIGGSKPNQSAFMSKNAAQVLIISYETFRMHAAKFHNAPSSCELLICDEAHRLKNANSQINRALSSLACRKRILLSGTPMQNDLDEFYAMADFTNPNILGEPNEFRKNYLNPILVGREPDSTDSEREKAQACTAMLYEVVNQFILRRGNVLNAKHLPPKITQVVCCSLSALQMDLYTHFLRSSAFKKLMDKENAPVLASITALKKLCNHPSLIFDDNGKTNTKLPGFNDCAQYFVQAKSLPPPPPPASAPQKNNGLTRRRSSAGGSGRTCHSEWSGKMLLLDRLMLSMRRMTKERIVVVSNYTQTLDVVSDLCHERSLPFVRLDGTTSGKKRKKLVDTFNDPNTDSFAFLLSSKAGGCGLNLIGANRLVLFDPDWNPATDKQAAARVWREGQKHTCYIYRFLATGTLEEKIFQRQLSKEGLQSIVDDKEEVNSLSSKDLKRLFVLEKGTLSDTHDQLKCERCNWRSTKKSREGYDDDAESLDGTLSSDEDRPETDVSEVSGEVKNYHPQIGMPPEEDLNNWGHHRAYESVDDEVMQAALRDVQQELVSFAFSCRVDWELLQTHQMENEDDEKARETERKRKRMEKIEAANKKRQLEEEKKNAKKRKTKKVDNTSEEEESAQSSGGESDLEDDLMDAPMDEAEDEVVPIAIDESEESEVDVVEPPRKAPAITSQKPMTKAPMGLEEALRRQSLLAKDAASTKSDDNSQPTGTTSTGSATDDKETWSCSRCTLENHMSTSTCDGCGLRMRATRI